MESTSKHEVIICRELIEGRTEVLVKDKTTSFVDNYQRIHHPTVYQHGPENLQRSLHDGAQLQSGPSDVVPLPMRQTQELADQRFQALQAVIFPDRAIRCCEKTESHVGKLRLCGISSAPSLVQRNLWISTSCG